VGSRYHFLATSTFYIPYAGCTNWYLRSLCICTPCIVPYLSQNTYFRQWISFPRKQKDGDTATKESLYSYEEQILSILALSPEDISRFRSGNVALYFEQGIRNKIQKPENLKCNIQSVGRFRTEYFLAFKIMEAVCKFEITCEYFVSVDVEFTCTRNK
jgi:hypothetical protein